MFTLTLPSRTSRRAVERRHAPLRPRAVRRAAAAAGRRRRRAVARATRAGCASSRTTATQLIADARASSSSSRTTRASRRSCATSRTSWVSSASSPHTRRRRRSPRARRYRPSAILLDINLPDHSGLGVLDQLKRDADTRHIPVHVVSVADYTQEALELGAVGYALKPVKREQLVDALEKLEAKLAQQLRRVLVVEDDARQRDSIRQLLASDGRRDRRRRDARPRRSSSCRPATFDCMVMDLTCPT